MRKNSIATIVIILGVLMISGIILYFINQNSNEEINLGKNTTLYISNGCPHCLTQLKILGKCPDLNVVDCTKEPNKCLDAGIIRVPTWIIDGKKYEGIKSIKELNELLSTKTC